MAETTTFQPVFRCPKCQDTGYTVVVFRKQGDDYGFGDKCQGGQCRWWQYHRQEKAIQSAERIKAEHEARMAKRGEDEQE